MARSPCILCNLKREIVEFTTKHEAVLFFVKAVATYCMSDRSKPINRSFCIRHLSIYSNFFWVKEGRLMSSGINAIISVMKKVKIVLYIDRNTIPWIFNPKEMSEQHFIEQVIILEFGAEYCKTFKKFINTVLPILISSNSKYKNPQLANEFLAKNPNLGVYLANKHIINRNPSLPNIMQSPEQKEALMRKLLESKIAELKAKEDEQRRKSMPSIETMIEKTKLMIKNSNKMLKRTYKLIYETDQLLESTAKMLEETKTMKVSTIKMIEESKAMTKIMNEMTLQTKLLLKRDGC
jgi:hypothetical protein